jgi:hypothetical protein
MSYTPTNTTTGPKKRKEDESSNSPVLDWDRIIHKNVRASDNEPIGTVIAIPDDRDTIILTTEGSRGEFEIPKSKVQGFNGAEVILDLPASEILSSYKVERTDAFEAQEGKLLEKSREGEQKEQQEDITRSSKYLIKQERKQIEEQKITETRIQKSDTAIDNPKLQKQITPVTEEKQVVLYDNGSDINRRNTAITSTTASLPVPKQQQQQQHLQTRRRRIIPFGWSSSIPEPRSTLLLVGVTAGVLTAGVIAWYYARRRMREKAEQEL